MTGRPGELPQQRCESCDAGPPLVGLGDPPEWLCLVCFNQALAAVGERIRQAMKARLN